MMFKILTHVEDIALLHLNCFSNKTVTWIYKFLVKAQYCMCFSNKQDKRTNPSTSLVKAKCYYKSSYHIFQLAQVHSWMEPARVPFPTSSSWFWESFHARCLH